MTDYNPTRIRIAASDKATNMFGWLDFILRGNLPFHFCESEVGRQYNTNLIPICYDTFMKYFDALALKVEPKLAKR
jgi:hypothetical protein